MRFMKAVLSGATALLLTVPAAVAQDAGSGGEYPGLETGKMWTFDVPPVAYWAQRYDFRPSQNWLDHVRLSAVRYSAGCSASFVSADGLVMTNHHCARACIESATRPGEDLLGDGFYAPTRAEERKCDGLHLDQLIGIRDVTDSVGAGITEGMGADAAADLRQANIRRLESACGQMAADAACQVVSMYRGGQYKLYQFRRFSDVRLVFAVESQTGFFGGDPDNFTYPRWDIDLSFVRAYVDDRPARSDYLRWSANGSKEGDLVFVIGNPGSTGRLNTMAQLEYLRDVQYPAQLGQLKRMIGVYHDLSAMGGDRAKALRNTLFSLENSQKAITGYQSGLLDPRLMAQKKAWEERFQGEVRRVPDLRRRFGDPWAAVARIRTEMRSLDATRRYHAFSAYGSRLLNLAAILVRLPAEAALPDSARLPQYREGPRAGLERVLASATPIDEELETRLLAAYLTAMQGELPAGDPVLAGFLAGRSPEQAAREMVAMSVIKTAAERQALLGGGVEAVRASADPFVRVALLIDPRERVIAKRWSELTNEESSQDEKVARALLAVFGNTVAPDATFSLRISDGEVKRYPMNGTLAPPFTTFYGLYDRHYAFAGAEPWHLTRRWVERRDSLDLSVPVNGVSTNDIIGGNSGSPVVNREAEVVGLIFDGNIEMLPNRFLFTEGVARSVWVDSRAIVHALRRVYDAGALADELTGM